MRTFHCSFSTVRRTALLCVIGFISAAASAQNAPDLSGVWRIAQPTSSLMPTSGAIPFTAEGKRQYQENKRFRAQKKFDDYDYMTSRCSSPGVPRIMLTEKRFEILQQPDVIMMAFEWNRVRRIISMPSLIEQHPLFEAFGNIEDLVGSMMGTSNGRWDGQTLVITTTKLSDRTLIDDLVPHGYDLKVTERLRLKDADTLEDHLLIEDPEYFTKAWEAVLTYRRQPAALMPEDNCLDRLLGAPPLPAH